MTDPGADGTIGAFKYQFITSEDHELNLIYIEAGDTTGSQRFGFFSEDGAAVATGYATESENGWDEPADACFN